jgi:hypothetical protein
VDNENLKWRDITSEGIFEYNRGKTGHDFAIKLSDTSLEILVEYKLLRAYDSKN